MKNLLNDPEVLQLYRDLQNKRFEDVNDFLTSNPADTFNKKGPQKIYKPKLQDSKMWFGGELVSDFTGNNDYGL